MHRHRRSLISISWTTCSPRRASRGASYGRKSERPASTRTRTSSLGARSFASRATERHTGDAETKTSDSIDLERRNKRHGAPGDMVAKNSPVDRIKKKKKSSPLRPNRSFFQTESTDKFLLNWSSRGDLLYFLQSRRTSRPAHATK
jgi:hypothetical protein